MVLNLFVTQDQVQENSIQLKLAERLDTCKTIAGVRSHHSFIPCLRNKLEMRRVSLDNVYIIAILGSEIEGQITVNWEDYQPGK